MRRLFLAAAFSCLVMLAQGGGGAAPKLKDYQAKALEHLWKQPGTKQFDPNTLPMEKILSSAEIAEGKCVIGPLQGKADWAIDPRISKPVPTGDDPMPKLRLLPVCANNQR